MLIIDRKIKLQPLVDIISHESVLEDLLEGIEEYITENTRKTVIKGQSKNVFYISGMAKKHHDNLGNYLNSRILEKHNLQGNFISGEFANYPTRHYWINIDGMIVDLVISQFKDKQINTYDKLRQLLDSHCFICDNPNNIIYRLYKPDASR